MQKINNYKGHLIAASIFIILTLLVFYQFFFEGLAPFPGNYMLAWYEPWKTDFSSNGTITIAHKPVADDVFRQLYPFKVLAMDLVKQLQWPLWNPYNGSGMPLMATLHTGFLNPFNVFFLFFPNPLAWAFHLAIQPILIGFFTYLYCRRISLSLKASIFSSCIFVLSGFVIVRMIFGEYILALPLLPLLLYAIESYLMNWRSKKIFLLPIAIFLLIISGHPQTTFYILTLSISYILYRYINLRNTDLQTTWRKILLLFTLFFIGIGLSSIQLIPTFELIQNSNVNPANSKYIFERFLLPLQHLITILIPNYFGNQATYNYWGKADYVESIAYLGAIPCFFAYINWIIKKKISTQSLSFFYTACSIITILSTLNWLGSRLLFSLPIPILSTSVPSRIFFLTAFSLAIVAGFGLEKWLALNLTYKNLLYKIAPFLIIISTLLAGTFLFYKINASCSNKFILDCRLIALRNTLLEFFLFLILIILSFIYVKYQKIHYIKNVYFTSLLVLTISIGLYNAYKFIPFSEYRNVLPTNNLINKITEVSQKSRVLGLGNAAIKTDFASYYHFYDPNYYDTLNNKRYAELIAFTNAGNLFLQRSDIEITNEIQPEKSVKDRRERLLEILSIKYLIFKKSDIKDRNSINILWQDNNWTIVQNPNSLPRAYAVSNFEIISDKEKLLKRLFDPKFDPKENVILEKNLLNIKYSPANNNYKQIAITDYEENKVKISSSSEENEILVLTDNYYPGWKAYLDKKETEIYRANYTLRAINVPKGNHIIEFAYEPGSLKIGGIISISSLLLLFFIFFWPKISGNKDHR